MKHFYFLILALLMSDLCHSQSQLVGFSRVAYDDCGNSTAQPNKLTADGIWTFTNPGGIASADLTIDYSTTKIQYKYNGLNPNAEYKMVLSYISDNTNRVQTIDIDGTVILSNRAVPYNRVERDTITVPAAAIADQTITLSITKVSGPNAVISQIELWSDNAAPKVSANFTSTYTSTANAVTYTFTDASTAQNTTINSWIWTFPGGTPSSYTGKTPPAVTFSSHGCTDVSLTVSNGTVNSTRTIKQSVFISSQTAQLARTPWSIASFSSQEIANESSSVTNILDGNLSTYWSSQWSSPKAVHPHEFQIDLGDTATVTGFTIDPRQGNANGKVRDYEFYTSVDGVNWGTAKMTGTFTWISSNDNTQKGVGICATNAKYVRFKILNTAPYGDQDVNCIAEFNVYGTYVRNFVFANFASSSVTNTNDVSYTFTDNSIANGTTITSWNWSFPGGTPSTFSGKTPPAVKYTTPGKYQVSLTVNDGASLSNTYTSSFVISGKDPLLWYNSPADSWYNALPIGNGDLGAMIFGTVNTERYQLNEKTVWAGKWLDRDKAGANYWTQIRNKFNSGDITGAESDMGTYIQGSYDGSGNLSYQTMGDLNVTFEGHAKYNNYIRDLDLKTSVSSVSYNSNNQQYTREAIASAIDNVIAIKYKASQSEGLTANFVISRPGNTYTASSDAIAKTVTMTDQAGKNKAYGGVNLESILKIVNTGGTVSKIANNELRVQGADEIVVFITGATDRFTADQHARNVNAINSAASKTYNVVKSQAIADYQQYALRADIELGSNNFYTDPTDVRLTKIKAGAKDPQMVKTFFQMGRYLAISSSRPTNVFPSNLQGIWADGLTPPWLADYHMNVNLQMNYFPTEVTNLGEMTKPYINFTDSLRRRGAVTAKKVYGCNGAFNGMMSDLFYSTSQTGAMQWGTFLGAGGWNCMAVWDHYLFTKDLNFLQTQGYQILKDYATFYADFLVKNPKNAAELICGPEASPENSYKLASNGQTHDIAMGTAGTHEIIEQLFRDYIEASKILNLDATFRERIQGKLDSLKRPMISKLDGRLCEWFEDYDVYLETDLGMRHTQHLDGFYPGTVISKKFTPDLYNAARKSLDFRVAHGAQNCEWTNAYFINYYARFKDAAISHNLIYNMLKNNVWKSLLGNYNNQCFQIDGNFGIIAGIAEMLIQSHEKNVEVLPALPSDWPNGSYKGLCARGGFVVDVSWASGKLVSADIYSRNGDTLNFVYGDKTLKIPTVEGKTYHITYNGSELTPLKKISSPTHSASVFPNPANSSLTIRLSAQNNGKNEDVVVNDINGRTVLISKILKGQSQIKLDMSGLKNGVYFVSFMGETEKVVVNK